MKNKIDYNQIVENLKQVHDPEISINVFDLGLIYNIEIDEEDPHVTITHTLTSAWCGFADEITENIRKAGYAPGVEHVEVITTFDPPFTMESVPEPSRELSKISSSINKFVFALFFIFATALQVKSSARSIRIFSPSLNDS